MFVSLHSGTTTTLSNYIYCTNWTTILIYTIVVLKYNWEIKALLHKSVIWLDHSGLRSKTDWFSSKLFIVWHFFLVGNDLAAFTKKKKWRW